jgi:pSer/pThr/pTyr-binding forkhead associated (FHA) protein
MSQPLSGTENMETLAWSENGLSSPMQTEESKLWGLLRRKGIDQEYKLIHRIKDGRKDLYTIGRQKKCDIVISDQRVSSIHCLIYCDYLDERLTMFVSDCSANGTFVNNSLIRLSSGERTELKSGDEIFLMNPRYISTAEGLVSFIFVNMRERLFVPRVVDVAPLTHQLSRELQSSESPHSNQRRIEDIYVIGNGIGHGMCGQVHVCTHKGSKIQYAVKIIDTKKFPKSPGLSASELRREAELMKDLNHPNIIQIKVGFIPGPLSLSVSLCLCLSLSPSVSVSLCLSLSLTSDTTRIASRQPTNCSS